MTKPDRMAVPGPGGTGREEIRGNGCTSDHPVPEYGNPRFWPCCRDCRYRRKCPYVLDDLLYQAADRGKAAACRMSEEAERLQQTISCARNVRCLLNGDRDMEDALCDALHSETSAMEQLCTGMKAFFA